MNAPPPPPIVGFPFLPVPDANGQLAFPSPEASVRDAIRVILSTRPGEQLMRPDFGGGLQSMLHLPNTLETRRQVQDLVTTSLQRWEPRISVDRVDVLEVTGAPARLRIEIAYRLRRTGAIGQMGVTLDFSAGGGG